MSENLPEIASPDRLSNVQILRGVAAVMVLIYHVGNELGDRGFEGAFPDVGAGSAGVDVFFVISGFVMVHSTAAAFGRPGAPGLFLARRLVRLVPLYWLVTTLTVLAMAWQAGHAGLPAQTWRWFAASCAFLFYPRGDEGDFPLYAQGWTLNFEMLFYIGFAAALPFGRATALRALAVVFTALPVLGLFAVLPWPATRSTDTVIVEFVLGLVLAEVHAAGIRLTWPVAAGLAAAGYATFYATIGSVDAWLPYRGFVWGPPALAVVAGAALYRPRAGGEVRMALEALGDASFSLYLVHTAFFAALGAMVERVIPVTRIPPSLYGAICFAGAIAVAFATHRLVERPMTRGLNRALDLPRRWRALTRPGDGGVSSRPS